MMPAPGLHRRAGTAVALLGALGGLLLACALFLAAAAPLAAPYRPDETDLHQKLQPPSWQPEGNRQHILGTDDAGRDMASRIIWGARMAMGIGVAATLLGALAGSTLGLFAGFTDGWSGRAVGWAIDVQSAFPVMLLAIFLLAVLGGGFGPMVFVLALAAWTNIAQRVRSQVLHQRAQPFVLAARLAGAGTTRLLRRHILPALLPAVAACGCSSLARVLLIQAALGFLGVSGDPSAPSWGAMLDAGQAYLQTAWWMAAFPGLAIALPVLGATLLGDWLSVRPGQRDDGP